MYVACAESAVFAYVTLSTVSLFDGDGCGCHRCLELRERETGMTRNSLTKQKEINYSAFTRTVISTIPKTQGKCAYPATPYIILTQKAVYSS